ncbi:MAG: RNA pseudouridine synthase [Pseudomonadaceae bacterium]|nr:RNA pseudouridine synthase [Pseudomonadaceae bacterium]
MPDRELEILSETDDLWVLNKPSGISLLADRSGAGCLWDQVKAQLGKAYLVHRLDKGTSGVLLIAKTQACQSNLTRAFQARLIGKHYVASVVGDWSARSTRIIDLPLRKGRKSRYRVAGERENIKLRGSTYEVSPGQPDGKVSTTRVRRLKQLPERTLVSAKPTTGRTHQLRVHLAWVGYPIVGDHLYGKPDDPRQRASRLALHCHKLVLPTSDTFVAPLADDFPT